MPRELQRGGNGDHVCARLRPLDRSQEEKSLRRKHEVTELLLLQCVAMQVFCQTPGLNRYGTAMSIGGAAMNVY